MTTYTEPFKISSNTYRFFRNGTFVYWNNIDQQGVEQLIDNKWVKLTYKESQKIAKLYVKIYKSLGLML